MTGQRRTTGMRISGGSVSAVRRARLREKWLGPIKVLFRRKLSSAQIKKAKSEQKETRGSRTRSYAVVDAGYEMRIQHAARPGKANIEDVLRRTGEAVPDTRTAKSEKREYDKEGNLIRRTITTPAKGTRKYAYPYGKILPRRVKK